MNEREKLIALVVSRTRIVLDNQPTENIKAMTEILGRNEFVQLAESIAVEESIATDKPWTTDEKTHTPKPFITKER